MKEQMLRNLLRQRLNEGTSTEEIRWELKAMGLDDDQIRSLAKEVSFSDSAPKPIETIHSWLPVVGMLLILVILGATATVVERPVLAAICLIVGVMMTAISFFLLYGSAVDAARIRFTGLRVKVGLLEAIVSDPQRHASLIVALLVGISLIVVGYFL